MTRTRSLKSRNAIETSFIRTPVSREGSGRSASLHTLVNTSAARKNCGRCEYRFECYPAEYTHELNDLQRIALSVRHALVYEHNSLPHALTWNWKQIMYFCVSLTAGAACYLAIPKLIDINELTSSNAWNHEDRKPLMEYNEGQREEERQHCLEKVNAERPRLLTELFQICGCGCGKPIVLSSDKHREHQQQQQGQISDYVVFNGKLWLKDHFHCSVCRKQMQGSVKLDGESETLHTTATDESEGLVFERNGKLFCVDDYLESCCGHCALCGKQLGDKLALDPRWGTAYCPECFDCYQESYKKEASSRSVDALFTALSFEDEEESDSSSTTTRGNKSSPNLPVGKRFEDVVDTERKLKGLYADVRNWMKSEFGITFESDGRPWHVEVKLAEGNQMTQAVVKQSHLAGEPNAVLGLTVKEIYAPSLLVQLAERLKGLLFQSGSEYNNQTEERKAHSSSSSSSYAKVKQVLLSRGLTRTHAGAVLAHELIHCWLALNVCPRAEDTLPHEVEEGLCEIFSYLYLVDSLQHLDKKMQSDRKKAKYVEFLLRRMENNNSTAQGKGFHRAFHSLQESHSLRDLLEHIKSHKQLPPPPKHEICT